MSFLDAEFSERWLTFDGVFNAIISEILNQLLFLTKMKKNLVSKHVSIWVHILGQRIRWKLVHVMFESYCDDRGLGLPFEDDGTASLHFEPGSDLETCFHNYFKFI